MDPVRAQYEAYPYPEPSPARDAALATTASLLEDLRLVCDRAFGGRRAPTSLRRLLVAGCGTGDAALLFAHQAVGWDNPPEIVAVDLSEASLAVAQRRAAAMGLTGIRWVHADLTTLRPEDLGTFDYINCNGVLHHLPDPGVGVRTLAGLLVPGGALGVMVYGQHGRAGLYPVQQMLRELTGTMELPDAIAVARRILSAMPPTSPLQRNPRVAYKASLSDAEVVDRYLHNRDVAYDVDGCQALMGAGGLQIASWALPAAYAPSVWLQDAPLVAQLQQMPEPVRSSLVEVSAGVVDRHAFFARPPGEGPTLGNVSTLTEASVLHGVAGPLSLVAEVLARGDALSLPVFGVALRTRPVVSLGALEVFRQLPTPRPLSEVFDALPAHRVAGRREALLAEVQDAYAALAPFGIVVATA